MDFMMSVLSNLFRVDEVINNKNRNGKYVNEIIIEEDIRYSETELLDVLYEKESKGARPIVINIHGGGWLVGDKKWRKGIAAMYAREGFFVINPNYALSPKDKYPECIRDIFRLCHWIDANSQKYNLDLDNIYITGDSAGGHLAAIVAGIQDNKDELDRLSIVRPSHMLSKAALFCGVYDYDKCVRKAGAAGLVKEMTGYNIKEYKKQFEFYRELSPINFVTSSYPSTYMVSAPFDIFCDGQAERLESKFKENNVKYFHYIPEDKLATHCFHLNLNRKDSQEAIGGAIDYFKKGTILEDNESSKDNIARNIDDTVIVEK